MARPKKQRNIQINPKVRIFNPEGGAQDLPIEDVKIGLDELEALKLTNLDELSQEETAEIMGVSRQLIGLLLSSVRKKITTALLEGKVIKIE